MNALDGVEDAAFAARVQQRIDAKTKPLGALGRIEALALQMALVLGDEQPRLRVTIRQNPAPSSS